MKKSTPARLTNKTFSEAILSLCERDRDLSQIVARLKPPKFRIRRPGFASLIGIVLAAATQQLKRLRARPTPQELDDISLKWKPWRAVAARLLWHYYLEGPNNEIPRRT